MTIYEYSFIALEKATGNIYRRILFASSYPAAIEKLEAEYQSTQYYQFVEWGWEDVQPVNAETIHWLGSKDFCKEFIERQKEGYKWQ